MISRIMGGAVLALALAAPAMAQETRTIEVGPAGLMDRANRTNLEPITLGADGLTSAGTYTLKSGGYYRIDVTSDGAEEQAIESAGLFRNVWINQVVINDLEVRPLGLDSIEFDGAGTVNISFVAIMPGEYDIHVRGGAEAAGRAVFIIE